MLMREYSVKEIESLLRQNGYARARSRGSHVIWEKDGCIISVPSAKLKPIIAHKIIKQLDNDA